MDYMEALEQIKQEIQPENSGQEVIHKITETERRRLMSNPTVHFVVSNGIIHDKLCPLVKGMSSELLSFRESYDDHFKKCQVCAIRTYIRVGAEDMGNYEKYLEFFDMVGLNVAEIRNLYVNHKCKTKLDGKVLTVKNRGDSWKIAALDSHGKVRLMHNNYVFNQDNTRTFMGGYHVQIDQCGIRTAISKITRYDCISNPRIHINDASSDFEGNTRKSYKKMSALQRLRYLIKRLLIKHYDLNGEINISDFKPVSEYGFPLDGALCVYIWEAKNGDRYWLVGSYSKKNRVFYATFRNSRKNIKEEKVIAWRTMTDNDFLI